MSMPFEQIKASLKRAATHHAQGIIAAYPASAFEAGETRDMITESIDRCMNEAELTQNLKHVGDDLLEEDFCEGYDKKGQSGNSRIFKGMLKTVLEAHDANKQVEPAAADTPSEVVSMDARRAQRERYSEHFSGKLTQLLQYYRWGFDAMHAIDRQLVHSLEDPDTPPANMYGYAYGTLKELHPDLDEHEISELIDGHIHAVLQSFLEDGFCVPLRIDPDDIPAAKDMPLHSFLLISKAYEVALAHTRASKLPEGTDMFDARLMREVTPLLKDLFKKDHYLCNDAGDFLETVHWLDHSISMVSAPKPSQSR